ncbi:MAG: hypothetical protein GEV06_16515 [Luteitalea sp.]|nr:hypothetical protein [Luteitalea sp.]
MKRLGIAAGLVCALCLRHGGSGAQGGSVLAVLEPVVLAESFDGDDLGQWASYPPAQDVGYEPSLSPTTAFDAPGGRALMRVVTPVVSGPITIGFIKEVGLVASQGADLAFAYRLEPRALAAELEVGLAGADGRRYTWRLLASAGAWTSAAGRFSQFRDGAGRGLVAGTRIEAVYVVAHIVHAAPDITSRLLLDDVRIAASRQVSFDVRQPASTRIEPWRDGVSSGVLRTGSTLSIEARAPVPLKRAIWSLAGRAGQSIARGALDDDNGSDDGKAAGNRWSDATAYRVRAEDPRGIWRLRLDGTTADGRRIETTVRLLVLPPLSARHPRLYFDPQAVGTIRGRRQHPRLTTLWTTLEKAARASRETGPIAHGGEVFTRLDAAYLLPSLPGYFDVLNRARSRITSNAAVGFVNRDREARAAARTALLEVSRWETWAPPWFEAHGQHTYYPAGQLASAVALAYDLLYADLSGDERRLVRRALLERSILPTWREYVLDNRVMADTSNWIAHTVGGAIIAAAAIVGDGSAEEDNELSLPLNGLLMKIEDHMAASFLADGSYGEGISYLEFDLETLGPMLWALERVFGQSYWESTHVVESLRYPLHTLADPIHESLDMGDTHPPAGHSIRAIVARSTDPVIRWYASRFEPRTIYDFLFFDDRVAPQPPAGGGSRLFREKGDAVFRAGWGPDGGLVLFRAGPTFNHNHADQGSFQFRALGETLITEAGWSDYYKDPYYDTFFTQAAGHNTLLVDGNPASQDIADTGQFAALNRHPRITDVILSPSYDAVGSELAPVYRGRLASYTRRLAYIKPDYLVVFDRVRTSGEPAGFTVRLHVPAKRGLTVAGSGVSATATYTGTNAALAVRPFSSTAMRLMAGEGHLPFPVLSARTPPDVPPQPAYLDLVTADRAADAWFMVVLLPRKTREAASAAAAGLELLSAPGWSGVSTIARGGARDVVAFSTSAASEESAVAGWRTDAAAWTARIAGPGVQRIGAQQVRGLRHGDRSLFESDRAVSVALDYGSAGLTGVIEADGPTHVRIHVRQAPVRTTRNGTVVAAAYDPAAGMLSLPVEAGANAIEVAGVTDR